MSADFNVTIGFRLSQRQWLALDDLAERHHISRPSYIRSCIFSKRPPFITDEERELWNMAKSDSGPFDMFGALKITSEQRDVFYALIKDAGTRSVSSYVRECIFNKRPKATNSSLDIARIRAGRYDKKEVDVATLRKLGRILQGAISVRCNKNRHQITLTLVDEDWEYLSNFYRWE